MAANTTLLKLLKPTVSGDADVWGGYLNMNFDSLDKLLSAITTTGSGAAYVLTSGQSLSAYAAGQAFLIKASFTCNAAATINVDGLGAKNITKYGTTATVSGDVISGNTYQIVYDGTQFQISGGYSDATITALAALSWSSGNALVQFTAADTVSLTLTPSVTSIALGAGAVGAPSLYMGGDTTTGFYRNAANQVSVTVSGAVKWTWSGNNLSAGSGGAIYLGNGSAAFPSQSFISDSTSGLYRVGSNNIGAAINGAATWDWNATRLLMASGFDLQRATDVTTPVAASVGYIGTIIRAKDVTYTIVANDNGYTLYHTSASAHTFTIDSNANLALPVGFMFKVRNDNGGGVVTVAITTDTLRWNSSTGPRSIAANGSATFTKQSSTTWFVEGSGIS